MIPTSFIHSFQIDIYWVSTRCQVFVGTGISQSEQDKHHCCHGFYNLVGESDDKQNIVRWHHLSMDKNKVEEEWVQGSLVLGVVDKHPGSTWHLQKGKNPECPGKCWAKKCNVWPREGWLYWLDQREMSLLYQGRSSAVQRLGWSWIWLCEQLHGIHSFRWNWPEQDPSPTRTCQQTGEGNYCLSSLSPKLEKVKKEEGKPQIWTLYSFLISKQLKSGCGSEEEGFWIKARD